MVRGCTDLRAIPGVRNCGSHIGQAFLLRFRRGQASAEEFCHQLSRCFRHIDKLHSGAAIPILPYHLPGQADAHGLLRQLELKIDFAGGRKLFAKLHLHSILGQIDEGGFLLLHIGVVDGGLGMHGGAGVLALFPAHDGACGAQPPA